MKSLTYDELKILFDNRKKDFDNNNKKGERKMSEELNIKPGDSFVLFFADMEYQCNVNCFKLPCNISN